MVDGDERVESDGLLGVGAPGSLSLGTPAWPAIIALGISPDSCRQGMEFVPVDPSSHFASSFAVAGWRFVSSGKKSLIRGQRV